MDRDCKGAKLGPDNVARELIVGTSFAAGELIVHSGWKLVLRREVTLISQGS